MPVTKFTLGEVRTRYYEYYRMTDRLREELSKKYNKEKVDQYHIDHAHRVNAKSAVQGNGPLVLRADDKDWLQRHPPLAGSGKAPREQA